MDPKQAAEDKLIELILQSAKDPSWRENMRAAVNTTASGMMKQPSFTPSTRPRCNCGFGGFHEPTNQRCDLTQWEQDEGIPTMDPYVVLTKDIADLCDTFDIPSDRRSDFTVSILALLGHEGMRQVMHSSMSNALSLNMISRLKTIMETKEVEGKVARRGALGDETYYLVTKAELFKIAREAKDLG